MLYKWDRYQFAAARAAMSSVMKAPIQLSIAGMIGEGDDVAVEAETDSEMLNGRRYNNRYHFVFRLRDGKFCEVREYSRSEEHTSELQSLMRISYAVFCLKKKTNYNKNTIPSITQKRNKQ